MTASDARKGAYTAEETRIIMFSNAMGLDVLKKLMIMKSFPT